MSMLDLCGDDVFIESPSGERIGPVKASVQGNKVFIPDETVVVEEGGKILRPLPNGKSESHLVLQVNFHNDPFGDLSHYEVRTRKEASLVPTPSKTTINITNSHGVVIGDGNIQNIVTSFKTLRSAIEDAQGVPAEEKTEAKGRLKALLSHPLVVSILGAAAGGLVD